MPYVQALNPSAEILFPGAVSCPIFQAENTPITGCSAMVNTVTGTEYPPAGVHDDNEGFFVVSGKGMIQIGGVESPLAPGTAAYAPAGIPHAMRKLGDEELVLFVYHFPK